jgi:formylmethanofuran dehydrogenase subunit C
MRALTLRLRSPLQFGVDLSRLTPDGLAGLQPSDIARIELAHGRERLAVGEVFDVSGEDTNDIRIRDSSPKLHRIGATMSNGKMSIEGDCGSYLGLAMRGGEISLHGNAGLYAASGLRAGAVRIHGNSGDFLGAALPGERRGMAGGTVVVSGNAGDRVGDFMRRGMLIVEGAAGDYCASRMLAGTIAVLGDLGKRPGYLMQRGTLFTFKPLLEVPPTFRDCGAHSLGFLALMRNAWRPLSGRVGALERPGNRVQRYLGDIANDGKGEILVWL